MFRNTDPIPKTAQRTPCSPLEAGHRHLLVAAARLIGMLLFTLGLTLFPSLARAHEHLHTHANLTVAGFRLLQHHSDFFDHDRNGLTPEEILHELRQGVIDEDLCLKEDDPAEAPYVGTKGSGFDTNNLDWRATVGNDIELVPYWNSHFFNAGTGEKLKVSRFAIGVSCRGDGSGLFGPENTTAPERAHKLWDLAIGEYEAAVRMEGDFVLRFKRAYRILGRIAHLLQDMTSPPHAHTDSHFEFPSTCGHDGDDFEKWGWCEGQHIFDYVEYEEESPYGGLGEAEGKECLADFEIDGTLDPYGIPPPGINCRAWAALTKLFKAEPQGGPHSDDHIIPSGNSHLGFYFVRSLSQLTYNFTSFKVKLDEHNPQPDSELKRMLRGSTKDDCGGFFGDFFGLCEGTGNDWWMLGSLQEIGRTKGFCGNREANLLDFSEEWWIEEPGCINETFPRKFEGSAYIENIGGQGPDNKDPGPFIPLVYEKTMFKRLYGTHDNEPDPFIDIPCLFCFLCPTCSTCPICPIEVTPGKDMLRIYGDVMYPTAIAYTAGLIDAFDIEVTGRPFADAGGPYEGEACRPITFDARGSSDTASKNPELNGEIVLYEWDFDDDGTFDQPTASPVTEYAYPDEYHGQARLRVTDEDGYFDVDTADVEVGPDVTPPVITNLQANPNRLWPPKHKMRPVSVEVEVFDLCDAECLVTDLSSSEPANASGDGNTEPDWAILGPLDLELRAERSGMNKTGRVYSFSVVCTDDADNVSDPASACAEVPHSKKSETACDNDVVVADKNGKSKKPVQTSESKVTNKPSKPTKEEKLAKKRSAKKQSKKIKAAKKQGK